MYGREWWRPRTSSAPPRCRAAPPWAATCATAHRPPTACPRSLQQQRWLLWPGRRARSEEHTSELQSPCNLVCRLLLEKKKKILKTTYILKKIKNKIKEKFDHIYI